MDPVLRERLKAAYNRLDDRPLDPGDPFYVPFLENSGDDPIADLATSVAFARSESVHLVSGQRGNGKSTELRRLKRRLEHDEGCAVFLCDMRDYMNLTTEVEITDFLISVLGAWDDEIYERHGFRPTDESYWTRAIQFLSSELKIESLNLEAGTGDAKLALGMALKQDPSFRAILQKGMRGHVARFVQNAQGYASEVVEALRQHLGQPDLKVVLLVDSVEQIRGVGAHASDVHRSVENLFSGNVEWLKFGMLHVVYTIPPYLQVLAPGLGAQLGGGTICSLPSVHVRNRDGTADAHGIDVLRKIVTQRIEKWRELFTEEQLRRAALSTGGDLRDFFRLLRNVIVKASHPQGGGIPVADPLLDQVEDQLRRDMLPIADDDREWLLRIEKNKRTELKTIAELPRLARFFDTTLVLNYRNGEDWYDVHPLLRAELAAPP